MIRSRKSGVGKAVRVAGALLAAGSLVGCTGILTSLGARMPQELAARGVAAEAEVLAVWDTGWSVNDDPVVGMKVRVLPSAGAPYEATIEKTLVSRIGTWQFQPGNLIPVRYDPQNPAVVAVDREPPVATTAASGNSERD